MEEVVEPQAPIAEGRRAGAMLAEARAAAKLELAEVSARTRIPQRHLAAIEAGDYAKLPSRTYAVGFSRTYARLLGLDERAQYWGGISRKIGEQMLTQAWNPKLKAFSAALGSDDLDASVLLLAELGLIPPNDPRFVSTVEVIGRELRRDKHVMRYVAADDFGLPETAFLICRFWLIDAMWETGRQAEARSVLERGAKLGEAVAWLPLGNFYADEMGDEEAAEEAYRGGIAAGEVHCHHNLAYLLAERGDLEGAVEQFRMGAAAGDALAADALRELEQR